MSEKPKNDTLRNVSATLTELPAEKQLVGSLRGNIERCEFDMTLYASQRDSTTDMSKSYRNLVPLRFLGSKRRVIPNLDFILKKNDGISSSLKTNVSGFGLPFKSSFIF